MPLRSKYLNLAQSKIQLAVGARDLWYITFQANIEVAYSHITGKPNVADFCGDARIDLNNILYYIH